MTSQGNANAFQNLDGGAQGRGRVSKIGLWPTTFEPDFTNTGDLLFNGWIMRFNRSLTQDATGLTRLDGGWLVMWGGNPFLQIQGTVDRGGGLIIGNFINLFGTVLALSGDTLHIQGNFTQSGGTTTVQGSSARRYALSLSGGSISATGGTMTLGLGVPIPRQAASEQVSGQYRRAPGGF